MSTLLRCPGAKQRARVSVPAHQVITSLDKRKSLPHLLLASFSLCDIASLNWRILVTTVPALEDIEKPRPTSVHFRFNFVA